LVGGQLVRATALAEVYTYIEQTSGTTVEVKASVIGAGDASLEAINHEARLLERLAGLPGVPQRRQVGTLPDGRRYLLLDQPAGQPLAAMMVRPVKPDLAVRIALALAEVLGAVHQLGVAHQGVAPSAVYLTPDHAVAVVDLTLGGELGCPRAPLPRDRSSWAPYAAPEVLQPEGQIDVRADVYSAGAVLYAMLHGQAPGHNPTGEMTAVAVVTQVGCLAAASDRPAVPPALEAVLARALAAKPNARFATMGALAGALAEVLAEPARQGNAQLTSAVPPQQPAQAEALAVTVTAPSGAQPAELSVLAVPDQAHLETADPGITPARRRGHSWSVSTVDHGSPPVDWPVGAWPLPGVLPRLMSGWSMHQGSALNLAQPPRPPDAAPVMQAESAKPPVKRAVAQPSRTDPGSPPPEQPAAGPSQPAPGLRRIRRAKARSRPAEVTRRPPGTASPTDGPKPARSFGRMVAGAGAVLVLTLGGGAAWWFGRVPPAEAVQVAAGQLEGGVAVDSAPTPQDGLVSVEASGAVVFTWENPAPQPGDTYSWVVLDGHGQAAWQVVSTNRLVLPPSAAPGPLCVEVRLVRHSGKVSEPGLRVCQ